MVGPLVTTTTLWPQPSVLSLTLGPQTGNLTRESQLVIVLVNLHQLQSVLTKLAAKQASDETVVQEVKSLLATRQREARKDDAFIAPSGKKPRVVTFGSEESREAPAPKPVGGGNASAVSLSAAKDQSAKAPLRPPQWGSPKPEKTEEQSRPQKQRVTSVAQGEWTCPVALASLTAVNKALSSGGALRGNLVVVPTPEHLQELFDQWKALSCDEPLTVLVDCHPSEWPAGASSVKASCKRGGKDLRTEAFLAAKLGDSSRAPWVKPAIQTNVAKHQPPSKTTLRIAAPAHYRQLYRAGWDDAEAVLTELANWQDGPVSALLGGRWKWIQMRNTFQLVAHLKVGPKIAEQLLAKSGRNGIFVTTAGTAGQSPPNSMFWFKQLEGEDAENYFRRSLAAANDRNQSLKIRAGGGNDLGVLRLPSDSVPVGPCVLKAQVPRSWENADIDAFFKEQGWQEIQVFNRIRKTKQGAFWTLKGLPPEDARDSPWHYVDDSNPDLQVYIQVHCT